MNVLITFFQQKNDIFCCFYFHKFDKMFLLNEGANEFHTWIKYLRTNVKPNHNSVRLKKKLIAVSVNKQTVTSHKFRDSPI